jgi:hypothetical protein
MTEFDIHEFELRSFYLRSLDGNVCLKIFFALSRWAVWADKRRVGQVLFDTRCKYKSDVELSSASSLFDFPLSWSFEHALLIIFPNSLLRLISNIQKFVPIILPQPSQGPWIQRYSHVKTSGSKFHSVHPFLEIHQLPDSFFSRACI